MAKPLTYALFESTGWQDCDNVFEIDDFDLQQAGTPEEVIAAAMMEWDKAGGEKEWISQQDDDFEGLDPHLAYEAWKKGWAACALGHVSKVMSLTFNRVERKFFEILQDPDPSSVDIAEDYAIQHGLKLRVLGWKAAHHSGILDPDDLRTPFCRGQFANDLFTPTLGSGKTKASEWQFTDRSGDVWLTRIFAGETWVSLTGQHLREVDAGGTALADKAAWMAWRDFKIMKRLKRTTKASLLVALESGPISDTPEELINPAPSHGRRNPAAEAPEARDEERAVDMYRGFNRFDPKELVYDATFKMPTRVRSLGEGVEILYESMKVIPDNLVKPRKPQAYVHEFEGDVVGYACDGTPDTDVPDFIQRTDALALLGNCLGYTCKNAEGQAERPLPELYATPCGRALLVIQSKKQVLAMFWGGALDVEPRGITG